MTVYGHTEKVYCLILIYILSIHPYIENDTLPPEETFSFECVTPRPPVPVHPRQNQYMWTLKIHTPGIRLEECDRKQVEGDTVDEQRRM